MQNPPRRDGRSGDDPPLEAMAQRRPHQGRHQGRQGDGRPEPVRNPVRERYQGRRQPGVGRRAEEWLSDLVWHQRLLLDPYEALVVDQRPPVFRPNPRRRKVGVKVDPDWLVAIQNIEGESDEHDREPKPGPQPPTDSSAPRSLHALRTHTLRG